MSDADAMEIPPQPSALRLIATLGGIAVMSGLLVVSTVQLTAPRIAENRRVALERAVFSVLPGAVRRESYRVDETGVVQTEANANLYAGYDESGALIGYALEGAARGYQDVVRLLYGFDPETETVIGMTVLQSTETPGLGDKIIHDEAFHENFRLLDVSRPVEVVKAGEKTEPWQIDGISGATVSSQAVGEAIRRGAEQREAVLTFHRADRADPIDPTDRTEEGGTQ